MDNTVDGLSSEAQCNGAEINNVEVPQSGHCFPMELGMCFESDENAISYYNNYAGSVGFSIRKEYANKSKFGYITSRKVSCSNEGYRAKDKRTVKTPRKDTRTGCLSHIVISRVQSNGKYLVTSFAAEHNHPLAPKGTEHMLRSQKKINKVEEPMTSLENGTQKRRKSLQKFEARYVEGRAYLGYTDKDQRSYLQTKRQREMELGEEGSLLDYFEKRRLEDPSSFFAIQLDADDLITNVFWADSKMIVDHKFFGDIIFFETQYKTNADYKPLALFGGMDHYKKMLVFGAAMMYDETIYSYKWLFETFLKLKAMSGRKPETILTYQDTTISEAVSLVIPKASHRFCTWHIEHNALKHLDHVFKGSDSFGKDFYKLIHDFEEETEFLNAWEVILDEYDLRDNDWLKDMFSLREKWATVYGRNTFSAGMVSTQLSKSFNTALVDCLQSDHDLVRFFELFESAVDDHRCRELDATYGTQGISMLKVHVPILTHANSIYTPVIFEIFQNEWAKSLLVTVSSCMEDGPRLTYKVTAVANSQGHIVIAKPSGATVSCSCKKFEHVGVLCCHALKILAMMNVKLMIPSRYVLKRWTKCARVVSVEAVQFEDTEDLAFRVKNRYELLCPTFVQIASRASESKSGYELAVRYVNQLASQLESISETNNSDGVQSAPSMTPVVENVVASNTKAKGVKGELARRMGKRSKIWLEKGRSKKMAPQAQLPSNDEIQSMTTLLGHVNPCSIPQEHQMSQGLHEVNPMEWGTYQQAQTIHDVTSHCSYFQCLRDTLCLDLFEDSRGLNTAQNN